MVGYERAEYSHLDQLHQETLIKKIYLPEKHVAMPKKEEYLFILYILKTFRFSSTHS